MTKIVFHKYLYIHFHNGQHHGLGHLPQPDNFTTCGRLGIEINQYNNPVECYADETIDEMREEKIILDHPELADKIVKGNAQVKMLKFDLYYMIVF